MPFEGSGTGPAGSWSFSSNLGNMFDALINNYNKAASYQVEDMSSMPSRNRIAFSDYQTRNALKNEGTQQDIRLKEDSYNTAKNAQQKALILAERQRKDEAARADLARRSALNAAMGRQEPALVMPLSNFGKGTGALADFYDYGQGSAAAGQSRGGGNAPAPPDVRNQANGDPLYEEWLRARNSSSWGPR